MPRAKGDKEYRLPNRGLNTEVNVLDFPQDSAVDLNNLELDLNPMKLRVRLGHTDNELDANGTAVLAASSGDTAYSWFLWESAGNDTDSNFLVIQQDRKLLFVDADDADLTATSFGVYLDLNDVISLSIAAVPGLELLRREPVQYSRVKGFLLITSRYIEPTLLRYDPDAGTISFTRLTLQVRDTLGLESGIEVDKRSVLVDFPVGDPASSNYPTMTEVHEYNLYNQGWYQQRRIIAAGAFVDPITNFITNESVNPSNADITYLAMLDSGGSLIFDSAFIEDLTLGATPAPRGHYIYPAFLINRDPKLTDKTVSGAYTGGASSDGGTDAGSWIDIPGTV